MIGRITLDPLEDGIENGENLHVAVIVDGSLAVGLQMERIDHVHVVQVGGGGLIGQVDRVLEGQIPDGEGLILGVTGLDAPLVFMVELGETGSHLAAAGTGSGDDHHAAGGLNVFVAAQSSSLTTWLTSEG